MMIQWDALRLEDKTETTVWIERDTTKRKRNSGNQIQEAPAEDHLQDSESLNTDITKGM